MHVHLPELSGLVLVYLLVFARTGAMVMLLPAIGEASVPPMVRLVLALAISLALAPTVQSAYPQAAPASSIALGLIIAQEVTAGILIGTMARIIMSALQVAGTLIATQTGLAYASTVDPTSQGEQSAIVANFFSLLAVVLIFATNLHHLAIAAVAGSYHLIPPGGTLPTGDMAELAIRLVSGSFALGFQMAAPFLVFGFALSVGLGVLARLMPQLQIYMVAMPANILVGFILMALILASLMTLFLNFYTGQMGSFLNPMADEKDKSTQTEEPTSKRLAEAHDHGDVVKSTEVSTFVVLAGGTLAIAVFGRSAAESLATTMRLFLEQPDQFTMASGDMQQLAHALLGHLATILVPFFVLMMAAGLGGNLIQHRPVFTFERIKPDFSKLSLGAGLKRMFGIEGLMNLGKGLIKIAIVGAAVWTQVWPERNTLESVLDQSPAGVAGDMSHLLFKVLIAALAALAVIAGADYFMQRFRFMQRNRMSKQEIKEEYRQTEGDPAVKAKIRQIRNERSRRRMIAAVPEATVVIMNPTHFAVALKYESGKMAAPVCVAKGVDALALRIREVAEDNDVPVVENPPLARALHASVEVDQAIPAEHYKAVAQVIGYVMRLNGQMRAN